MNHNILDRQQMKKYTQQPQVWISQKEEKLLTKLFKIMNQERLRKIIEKYLNHNMIIIHILHFWMIYNY